jgi:hypothetical protein
MDQARRQSTSRRSHAGLGGDTGRMHSESDSWPVLVKSMSRGKQGAAFHGEPWLLLPDRNDKGTRPWP